MVSSSPAQSTSVEIVRLDRLDGLNLLNFHTEIDAATPSSQNTSLPTPQSDDLCLNNELDIRSHSQLDNDQPQEATWPPMEHNSSPVVPPAPPIMKDMDSFSQGSAEGSFASIPAASHNEFGEPVQPLAAGFMEAYNEAAQMDTCQFIQQWRVRVTGDMPFMVPVSESKVMEDVQVENDYQLPFTYNMDDTVESDEPRIHQDLQYLSPTKRPRSPSVTSGQRQRRTRQRENSDNGDHHHRQQQSHTPPLSPIRSRGRPRHRQHTQQGISVPEKLSRQFPNHPTPTLALNMTPPPDHCNNLMIENILSLEFTNTPHHHHHSSASSPSASAYPSPARSPSPLSLAVHDAPFFAALLEECQDTAAPD